jgi:hypothetical protein
VALSQPLSLSEPGLSILTKEMDDSVIPEKIKAEKRKAQGSGQLEALYKRHTLIMAVLIVINIIPGSR